MARFLSAALAVALAATVALPTAAAQDGGDHYDQMINAVQERKARSFEQVMTAPGKVQDYMRHTDVDLGFEDPPQVEHKVNPLEDDGEPWTGTQVLFIALGLAAVGGFFLTRKLASR